MHNTAHRIEQFDYHRAAEYVCLKLQPETSVLMGAMKKPDPVLRPLVDARVREFVDGSGQAIPEHQLVDHITQTFLIVRMRLFGN